MTATISIHSRSFVFWSGAGKPDSLLYQVTTWHTWLSLILGLFLCGCHKDPPSNADHGKIFLEVTNSLAIPNHRVAISISGDQLAVIRQNNGGESLATSKKLSSAELAAIWTSMDAVNWQTVKKDQVLGLDGTTYRIRLGEDEFDVWSPDTDIHERDLTRLVDLKKLLWRMAEITW